MLLAGGMTAPARPSRPSPESAIRRRLMVVEQGASLSFRDDQQLFDETTAITQLAGEGADDLVHRTLTRLALAERSGQPFDAAMLFVGERGSSSARSSIGLGLAAHAARGGGLRELVIVAPPDASQDLRDGLLQLTDELLFGAERPLQIRVCFAESASQREQRSGTFWCAPESE